jgi:predicted Na+-dependent transporter
MWPNLGAGEDNNHKEARSMFSELEQRAFALGRRMADANFILQDNPFMAVHPRLANQWSHGFLAANVLRSFASAFAQRAPDAAGETATR